MVLLTWLAALFAIAFCLGSTSVGAFHRQASVAPRRAVTPTWRMDLRSTIESVPLGLVIGHGHETQLQPHTSLWFLDDATIVVTFVIHEGKGNPKLSRRDGSDENLPLELRAVFLDAVTGKVTAKLDWPSESRYASIVATHVGEFVTERGTQLTLYSKEFDELRKLELPPTKETGWVARPSPTGKNILFIAENLKTRSAVPWIWIDTDGLQVLRSWEEPQSGWVGISDKWIAMAACGWVYDCEPNIEIRGLITGWKSIVSASRHQKSHPQFINDDLVFLLGHPTRMVQSDGKTVLLEDLPFEGCWWGGAVSSAGGSRLAVPSCKLTGAVAALDRGGSDVLKKILLYDAPFHGLSYVLDFQGPVIKEASLLALSPDGLQLAILNDESVEVVRLPALQ
jgi:hypothetical protein